MPTAPYMKSSAEKVRYHWVKHSLLYYFYTLLPHVFIHHPFETPPYSYRVLAYHKYQLEYELVKLGT